MVIFSNGSKWAGQQTDSIDELIAVLNSPHYALDPTFELYGKFISTEKDGSVSAFGNFANISHVFNVRGSKEEMRELSDAIRRHLSSARYRTAFLALYGSDEAFREVEREHKKKHREQQKRFAQRLRSQRTNA